jgi:hypothetical protein
MLTGFGPVTAAEPCQDGHDGRTGEARFGFSAREHETTTPPGSCQTDSSRPPIPNRLSSTEARSPTRPESRRADRAGAMASILPHLPPPVTRIDLPAAPDSGARQHSAAKGAGGHVTSALCCNASRIGVEGIGARQPTHHRSHPRVVDRPRSVASPRVPARHRGDIAGSAVFL